MTGKQNTYEVWIRENETDRPKQPEALLYKPLFSVFVFHDQEPKKRLKAYRKALASQTYHRYEVIRVEGTLTERHWKQARGEYVIFLRSGHILAANALYEMASFLNYKMDSDNRSIYDFVYSDEDCITEKGRKRYQPFFKPDWSPDLFWCMNYTGQLAVYRTCLATEVLREMEQDAALSWEPWIYDFTLRFLEKTKADRTGHVSKILCHKKTEGNRTPELMAKQMDQVKQEALKRRSILAHLEKVPDMELSRVVYEYQEHPLVSIIIPSKDNVPLLRQCLNSLEQSTTYHDYEIVLVDNGSTPENKAAVEQLIEGRKIRYHYEPMIFNFSRMCNLGAGLAKGEYLLFLNDDIEVIQPDWIDRMLGQTMQQHTGAVGAKLLYPDSDRIQHAGVANLKMGPSHYLRGQSDGSVYCHGRNRLEYNCLAVTAACLMVKREHFEKVGGFEERLAVTQNDVEFCIKLHQMGLANVIRNDVCLIHHESVSRGLDAKDPAKMERLDREKQVFYELHPDCQAYDPYYSVHYAQDQTDFRLNILGDAEKVCRKIGVLRKADKLPDDFRIHLDEVELGEEIRIRGWFYWENDYWTTHCQAYVVLQEKNGRCVYYETHLQERVDVAEALGHHANDCGFLCRIAEKRRKKQEIQRVGVLLKVPDLRIKKLRWSDWKY